MRNPLDIKLPSAAKQPPKGTQPARVHIERSAATAVVRVDAPAATGGTRGLVVGQWAVSLGVLIVAAAAGYFVFGKAMGIELPSSSGVFPLLATLPLFLVGGFAVLLLVLRLRSAEQALCFRADASGLTIDSLDAQGRQRTLFLPRDRVRDILLGFGHIGGNGRHAPAGISVAWLRIRVRPWYRLDIRCLRHLGGDELGPIADALRHALGLPRRSWP